MKIEAEISKHSAAAIVPLLTSKGLAERLGIAESTVEWWRSQKQGPKYIRLGRGKRAPIRYEPQAVEEYLREMKSATEQH